MINTYQTLKEEWLILEVLTKIDDVMYYHILIVVLAVAGIYFSFKTGFIQLRLFR